MGRQLKTWTALGFAALGTAGMAQADSLGEVPSARMILAQAATDTDGEGGGEGGGSLPTTYALESQNQKAFAYDAKPQVKAYVDLVQASYARAAADAMSLQQSVAALLAAPTQESLDAARKAWVAARPAYLRTEAFRFYDGPIEAVEGDLNAWPVNEAYIDYVEGNPNAGLVNDPSFKLDSTSLAAANQSQDEADVTVGWHAIEFMLWGQDLSTGSAGNRPYTDYAAGTGSNDRRRAYLKLVTDKLVADLQGLAAAWEDQDPMSLAARMKTMPQREALGRMINGMAILAGFEFMSERLAVALDSGDQEDEHSCFSDTTKQDFVHDLLGIRQVWTGDADGKSRPGLDELVRAQDPALADRLDALFTDAEAKVNALGDPWDKVLAAPKDSPERQAAEQAVASLQALADGLVAVGNKLGVLVLVPSG
jgi:putative iron-regulated protein